MRVLTVYGASFASVLLVLAAAVVMPVLPAKGILVVSAHFAVQGCGHGPNDLIVRLDSAGTIMAGTEPVTAGAIERRG